MCARVCVCVWARPNTAFEIAFKSGSFYLIPKFSKHKERHGSPHFPFISPLGSLPLSLPRKPLLTILPATALSDPAPAFGLLGPSIALVKASSKPWAPPQASRTFSHLPASSIITAFHLRLCFVLCSEIRIAGGRGEGRGGQSWALFQFFPFLSFSKPDFQLIGKISESDSTKQSDHWNLPVYWRECDRKLGLCVPGGRKRGAVLGGCQWRVGRSNNKELIAVGP